MATRQQIDRMQRSLIIVEKQIVFWGGFEGAEEVIIDGTACIPKDKLAKAEAQREYLLAKLQFN